MRASDTFPEPLQFNGDLVEREPSPCVRYRCTVCAWTGSGVQAFDHHQQDHHRIVVAGLEIPAYFACCAGGIQERPA